LGNGDGSFQSPVQYATAPAPLWITTGDLNGDLKQDLLVATICPPSGCTGDSTGSLSILFGNGNGTFQPRIDYEVACTPTAIATGEFNGDGHLDVAVDCPGVVNIFLGNGDGTLQQPSEYPHIGYGAMVAEDFNGDRKTDLTIQTGGFTVSLLLGNGDGTFQPEQVYVGGDATNGWEGRGSAMGDFNRDGKPDLATSGRILLNIANFPEFSLSVGIRARATPR
jgi:hypothetical protein